MTLLPDVLLVLFGLVFGSFLNVVIHRLPAGESLLFPGSRCPRCAAPIRLRDNLPVLSFVLLRGRCRDCRAPIPVRYPLVEVLTAIVVVSAPSADTALFCSWVLFGSLLLVLGVTDWERMVLPDALTLPGAALGLLLAAPRGDLVIASAALGALLGAGLLLALRLLWLRFRKVEAVGRGDIKMLLMIGAFLGPAPTLAALALASALGLLAAAPLLLSGRIRRDTPLPFGSLLALGAAAVFAVSTSAWPPAWRAAIS